MPSHFRLRRSPWIVSYWESEQLIYHNYLSGVRITADPLCTSVLDFFNHWSSAEELVSRMDGFKPDSVRRAVARLTALTFLEKEGAADPRSRAMQAWSDWSPQASFFHFATKDVRFQVEPDPDIRAARQYLRRHPRPPFYKRYPKAEQIQLLPGALPRQSEFLRALLERRTWREFSPRALRLDTLAQLLHLTWGVTSFLRDDLLGRIPLKTSPSAGACHPIEVYVVPLRVAGLPQGLYHYIGDHHRLECLRRASMRRRAIRYLAGQHWFGQAAAIFLMTAVFPRAMWKYDYARTYRSVLLDAGHLCQTFCLAATWLGLAPFCTACLADSLIERDTGADGVTESAIYAAGVGVRP